MSLLVTEALSKHYAGLTAVSNVNFTLESGDIHGLIGPNGAGKSTFVGMLCGRIACSNGLVKFVDRDVTDMPAHKRMALGMAYTFQITSIFARLSVHENVALAVRRLPDSTRRTVDRRVAEALERVHLSARADALAGDLSYGHQRLLEIAMGLAQSPRLFIMDEPTQGLAESEIDSFKRLIRELATTSTILLIEHNMDVIMETAQRITVLNQGKVLAEGTPAQIRADEAVQSAYLGSG